MSKIEQLTSNMEDYLEAIYSLKTDNGFTRVGEIARKLDVKSPSVNAALKNLVDKGLVLHERYGYVSLTDKGEEMACEVKNKHDILYRFLTEFLMLEPGPAERQACVIEHALSRTAFVRLTKFFEFIEKNIDGGRVNLLYDFANYIKKKTKDDV
ncbi:MAG: metal-dependent transcriptional regulator [Candidatus Omnitrophica bacterium]|jgi:DtxR family Mn-dependent transcriptional regulator|nr:metal-dependent transcriptional regulator [Candidatus Omnitrophota bacterium]MDD5081266.1 metal-dependent transcriptional regulator [Candidatus Omnitrophota bacterium]MDD5441389.1 metal-dependent transcriptional regulator [Candidatus Omnitrophota bacterium]